MTIQNFEPNFDKRSATVKHVTYIIKTVMKSSICNRFKKVGNFGKTLSKLAFSTKGKFFKVRGIVISLFSKSPMGTFRSVDFIGTLCFVVIVTFTAKNNDSKFSAATHFFTHYGFCVFKNVKIDTF